MTAQKYLDKHTRAHYFAFLLRQNWPALVTNGIILFLLNVVSLSMNLSDMAANYVTRYSDLVVGGRLVNMLSDYRVVNVVFASLLAILWGATTMPFLNSKVGINFHHSLPLTRERHYICEVSAKCLLFAVPLAVSNLFGYFTTIAIMGRYGTGTLPIFLQSILYALVAFLLYYSIMMFSASFTGTTFARLLACGMIIFTPSVLLLCLYGILEYSANYMSFTGLEEIAGNILLPVRTIFAAQHDRDVNIPAEIIGALILSALFFLFGVLIYKRRKSELSGTPVISVVARGLMKYSAIFVAATAFAFVMEEFADGTVGIYIGGAIGTILAAMLMNTILTKSAKKMFAGVRGLVIAFAAFCVIFTVFGFDLIGLDTYIPAPSAVRSVTIRIAGVEMNLTDRADVKRVTEIVDAYFQNDLQEPSGYDEIAEGRKYASETISVEEALRQNILSDATYMMNDRESVRVTFKTVSGLRFSKRYSAPMNGTHHEILEIVANSEGFINAYFGDSVNNIGTGWIEITGGSYESHQKISETQSREIWYNMRLSYNGLAYFNRPFLTEISLEGTPMYRYPYYDGMEDAVQGYRKYFSSVYVVNVKTGEMKEYTDPGMITNILRAGVADIGYTTHFVPKDDTHVFFGVFGDKSDYRYAPFYFLKDRVPLLT